MKSARAGRRWGWRRAISWVLGAIVACFGLMITGLAVIFVAGVSALGKLLATGLAGLLAGIAAYVVVLATLVAMLVMLAVLLVLQTPLFALPFGPAARIAEALLSGWSTMVDH